MLVLKRRPRQFIFLDLPTEPLDLLALAGVRISVQVTDTGPGFARLGIDAPDSVRIARDDAGERKEPDHAV